MSPNLAENSVVDWPEHWRWVRLLLEH